MITALDTTVLLDVFLADSVHGPSSREAIASAASEGQLVACDAVWAETLAAFPSADAGAAAMDRLRVAFAALDRRAAALAAERWRAYRKRGGRRTRVIADFLVGAHVLAHADRLLTRDRGFYRRDFAGLVVVDPSRL